MNIGICRTSELCLIDSICEENDININFVRGLIDMFSENNNIFIKSPLSNEEEKIFNNQKLFIKYPFLKTLNYLPYDHTDLDILFILSKPEKDKTYHITEELTFEDHIKENILKNNEKTLCVYLQYNDVNLDINIKNKTIVLFNAPKENELHLLNRYYIGKNYITDCLDLNELVFNNRLINKQNFYNKVSLYNLKDKLDYEELKNPNSMNEGIYTLNEYNNGEDNDYIKNNDTDKYNILIEKLQHSNFVIFDNNNLNNDLYYNPMYYIISNYSYPILLNKNINHYFKVDEIHCYDYEIIDTYYSQKNLKLLRIEFKNYFKSYDLKSKLNKIFKENLI